ncbi:RAMP superfamily CRISPR-associated protein [Capilliphycus salinus ALCB114379]|uniref:RAMP superfamily CRISPR-associated protein n=1 Tax=Capilliphycus salinus TaxID=2768948 RepID=UPI0039A5A8C3
MTNRPIKKPNRPNSPKQPPSTNYNDGVNTSKPYRLISFPENRPNLQRPAGHHKFFKDRIHGTLELKLTVKTAVHVSTGIVAMGSDLNTRIPLIKTMVQDVEQKLSIQGSSLKGCVRAVYEAITNSTLAVITRNYKDKIPPERLPCRNKAQLCPASQVFGALDWQGLIEFNDAKCENHNFATGFMPSLYRPRPDERTAYFKGGKVAGRKFYYHTIRAIDKGQNQGISVQQAAKEYTFITQIRFKNLTSAELGTLLISLGQDEKYPMALKVGGGKPIGMGTMIVEITAAKVLESQNDLLNRYSNFEASETEKTGEELKQFIREKIQSAHSNLIQTPQLQQLAEVLRYPTDREPPEGMY